MRGSGEVRVIIRSSSLFVVVSPRGGCWRLVAEAGGDAIPRSEGAGGDEVDVAAGGQDGLDDLVDGVVAAADAGLVARSEEHTSELQSLMRISYTVLCLQNNKHTRIRYA